jgi:hypothetical protein
MNAGRAEIGPLGLFEDNRLLSLGQRFPLASGRDSAK